MKTRKELFLINISIKIEIPQRWEKLVFLNQVLK